MCQFFFYFCSKLLILKVILELSEKENNTKDQKIKGTKIQSCDESNRLIIAHLFQMSVIKVKSVISVLLLFEDEERKKKV